MYTQFPAHIHPDDKTITQSCQDHSRNTAQYAGRALDVIGLTSSAYLAGLLHDVGKCKTNFKEYLEAVSSGEYVRKGSVIHTFAGTKYLLRYHKQNAASDFSFEDMVSEMLAYAVGAHHGLFDCINESHENGFLHRFQSEPAGDADAVRNFLELCADEAELQILFDKAVEELIPWMEKSYDLAHDEDELYFYLGLIIRLLTSAVMEGDRRDTTEFMSGAEFPAEADCTVWNTLLQRVEKKLNDFSADTEINAVRRQISDICRGAAEKPSGIYRLKVPTGSGKTLSSLRYALAHAKKFGKKRIIFTSPLLSILDQNSCVIRSFLGSEYILEHHSNVILEQNLTERDSQYELLIDSWASPIIITTMVQLLNTMFDGKTSSVRRFHTLTDAVIVIDEVQTVPGKMLSLFNLTLSFLAEFCNTTILLCTATQPCFEQMKHPIRSPIEDVVPYDPELWNIFKRTDICFAGGYRLQDVPAFAEKVLGSRSSLLIVCNKKSESEMLFEALNNGDYAVFHLSAAMCMEHRRQTLQNIQESLACNNQKTICVATQVVEAGVDISFGSVIRLTAGLDSIIQSAGRCNRNGEYDNICPVYIIRVLNENLTHLKEIKLAQQAMEVLLDAYEKHPERFASDLSSDSSVDYYFRQLFAMQRQDHDSYHDYPVNGGISLFDLLSQNPDWIWEDEDEPISFLFHQAFASAGKLFEVFDSDTTDVIVPWDQGEMLITELLSEKAKYDFEYVKERIDRARVYTVSLYGWQKKKLEEYGALIPLAGGIAVGLAPEYYNNCTGVQIHTAKEVQSECVTLIW